MSQAQDQDIHLDEYAATGKCLVVAALPDGAQVVCATRFGAAIISCPQCLDLFSARLWKAEIGEDLRRRAATQSRTFLPKRGERMPAAYIQELVELIRAFQMGDKATLDLMHSRIAKARAWHQPEGKVLDLFPKETT